MSDASKIEWTDATWNPVTGCTKVSPGCDHCYAETLHERFHGKGSFATVTLHPDRLDVPLRWRKPRRVFVNSMSDLFHDDVPDSFIARIFGVMAAAQQHTFQVLTKRHGRMRALLNDERFREQVFLANNMDQGDVLGDGWPLRNVWLGVSTEDQKWADIRIPALLETPAAVRWISAEPLLGPINLTRIAYTAGGGTHLDVVRGQHGEPGLWATPAKRLDWVVVGGESGPGARPMDPEWARSLRDQCATVRVPFLFKQWGMWAPRGHGIGRFLPPEQLIGAPLDDMGHRQIMRRVGKARAGRELDGRTWDQYPAGVA
ncbi:phage Gp37/Gp68 family protein [Amycolatopsis sp. FU40]|uniref:DUF5131 family protein n=1 Tax=Amycolatopsis sp. FU40 TaxID=2914159 RepID=UPI001F1859D7|nr:phage Gp37/Gp68 family protein [Amycolatopsis sp. FU40]UKD55108.1 phage Gp37/Gp68 family protein [Amycolatopsis sp. FU40]